MHDEIELEFQGGDSLFGMEGLTVGDGLVSIGLSHGKAKPFEIDIPIVDGWSTSKPGVKPLRPLTRKRIERDANGQITAVVEEIG